MEYATYSPMKTRKNRVILFLFLAGCLTLLAMLVTGCSGSSDNRDAVSAANAIPHLEVTVVMTATQPSERPLVATVSVRNTGSLPWVFRAVSPPMMEGWQVSYTDTESHTRTTALWHQPELWACERNPSRTLLPGTTTTVQALLPNPGLGTWVLTVQSRMAQHQVSDGKFRMAETGPASLPVTIQVVDDDHVRADYDKLIGQALVEFGVWHAATEVLRETRFQGGNDPGWWLTPLADKTIFMAQSLVREPAFRSTVWISERSLKAAVALLEGPLNADQTRALSSALAEIPRLTTSAVVPVLRWAEAKQEGERESDSYYSDRILAHLPEAALADTMTAWNAELNPPLARRRLAAQIANVSLMNGSTNAAAVAVAQNLAHDVDDRTSFLALCALTWTSDVQAGQRLCDRLITTPGIERTTMALHAMTFLPHDSGITLLKRFARVRGVGWWADGYIKDHEHWPSRWP